ncbi:MAG: efflux RND transporter periplasmic adaptor subunit [Pseudomonadota bacterium]|nr:efflux RND transporter periplasmic adaptor subunit [Pseudomonadota bacterium]
MKFAVNHATALLLLTGCSAIAGASHEISISPGQMERLGINLAPVEAARWVTTERLPASVAIPPHQERVVSAPSAGLVTRVQTGEGAEVEAGAVLALMESPALVALQREFLQAQTESKLAAAEYKRDGQLHKEGIIAERRFLSTRARRDQANATLQERRQALMLGGMDEAAVAKLSKDRQLSSALEVKAPGEGVVLDVMAVLGQRVELTDPLIRIATLNPLWLQIRVPLERIEGVEPGAVVELPCQGEQARVLHIHRYVEPETQTVTVLAETLEDTQCLRPGQFVQVRLRLGGGGARFRVPASGLAYSGKEQMVFVHAAFGFLAVPVEVIGQADGYVVVSGDLSEDASVAVSGIAAIKAAWMGLGGGE